MFQGVSPSTFRIDLNGQVRLRFKEQKVSLGNSSKGYNELTKKVE